jgi:hypothetical protein
MYLVVSTTDKYKVELQFHDNLINAMTIGHEIHITRPILLLLFSMNLISRNDTIVTKNSERFFLYSNIFSKVIGYDDIPSNINNDEIFYITDANMWFHGMKDTMHLSKLEKTFPILTQIRESNISYRTEVYNDLIRNMNYTDCSNIIKKDFIVIHHRLTSYSRELNYTKDIISAIQAIDPDVQIFVFCVNGRLDGYPENITFVNDISIYASLMNHTQCKAVITEFSGGGQLAQYCHTKKIFYFCNAYPVYSEINDINISIDQANMPTSLYNKFDLKLFTNSSIYVFNDIQSLLKNINQYYFNNTHMYLRV